MLEHQRISRLIQQSKTVTHLQQIHTRIITHQLQHNSLISRLLFHAAIPQWASLPYASRIFHSLKDPSLNLYNIMIRAHASRPSPNPPSHTAPSLLLYKNLLCSGISPDSITVPFVVKECSSRFDVGTGRAVHGQVIRFGVGCCVFVNNSLISFYCVLGVVDSARTVFDEMPERDVVSWNSMLVGYLRSGSLDKAETLFRRMERRNVITWNSIITGFVQVGQPKEALELFNEMLGLGSGSDGVRPDKVTIASVLSACGYLGAVDQGEWVHGYLRRSGLECDVVIGTALVDMYGKCGLVERAYEVFEQMPKKDTLAWTAMISVLALHGYGREALYVFQEMEAQGIKPNRVTFVGLLSACAHAGLVEEGRWCFDRMRSVYSIDPQVFHYACMVDILARAGLFEEAEGLIGSMPMNPDVFVWGALLGGCQMHGNVELGERVARYLIDLEPTNHAFYMNLCDIYAKGGKFDGVESVRALMKERGIRKDVPGCSTLEIDGIVHKFSVSESHDVPIEELNWVIYAVYRNMKDEGHSNFYHLYSIIC